MEVNFTVAGSHITISWSGLTDCSPASPQPPDALTNTMSTSVWHGSTSYCPSRNEESLGDEEAE